MKVKVFGQPVEPLSCALGALFLWIGLTVVAVVVIGAIVVSVAFAVFNSPSLLLARKGRH